MCQLLATKYEEKCHILKLLRALYSLDSLIWLTLNCVCAAMFNWSPNIRSPCYPMQPFMLYLDVGDLHAFSVLIILIRAAHASHVLAVEK